MAVDDETKRFQDAVWAAWNQNPDGKRVDDPAPPPIHVVNAALRKEMNRLWDEAVTSGKVRESEIDDFKNKTQAQVRKISGGKITAEGVKRLAEYIAGLPVKTDATSEAGGVRWPVVSLFWKPDWEKKWLQMADVDLDQAVALSCDIDPDSPAIREFLPGVLPWSKEFSDRQQIAKTHASRGLIPAAQPGRFELATFAVWAVAPPREWELPDEFPRQSVAGNGDAESKPLTTKERTSLLIIIGALAKKGAVEIKRPTLAAREIRRIVRQELKSSISLRTVENALKQIDDALDRRSRDREEEDDDD